MWQLRRMSHLNPQNNGENDYVERSTDNDTEEIQDEIRLHELKGKNNGKA